jgi:hypothetical protein
LRKPVIARLFGRDVLADQRRATSADARLLGYRVTINNGILRKLCEKFGCSYNARSKTRVALCIETINDFVKRP